MNINKFYQVLKTTAIAATAVVTYPYGGKALDRLDEYRDRLKQQKSTSTDTTGVNIDTADLSTANTKEVSNTEIMDRLSSVQNNVEKLKNTIKNLKDSDKTLLNNNNEVVETMKRVSNDVDRFNEAETMVNQSSSSSETKAFVKESISNVKDSTDELIELLSKILKGGKGGDKYNISDYKLEIDNLYNYLDSLSLLQESVVLNILIFTAILLTIFSIIGIYLSNEIIKYFDLENKYPSLHTFLKIRSKLQRYYLIWNTVILFVLCF